MPVRKPNTLASGQTHDGHSWRLWIDEGPDGTPCVFHATWKGAGQPTIAGGSPLHAPAPETIVTISGEGASTDCAYVRGEIARTAAKVHVTFDNGDEVDATICPTTLPHHDLFIAFGPPTAVVTRVQALDQDGHVLAERHLDAATIAARRGLRR